MEFNPISKLMSSNYSERSSAKNREVKITSVTGFIEGNGNFSYYCSSLLLKMPLKVKVVRYHEGESKVKEEVDASKLSQSSCS